MFSVNIGAFHRRLIQANSSKLKQTQANSSKRTNNNYNNICNYMGFFFFPAVHKNEEEKEERPRD